MFQWIRFLATPIRNKSKKVVSFKSSSDCFHPKKHIQPWKYADDNTSPCETRTFTACKSIQNIHCLSGSGGSCKYCCRYVGKIDKENYSTVSTSDDIILIRHANVLNNTKRVTSDKVQQAEREKKRNSKHPQGTFISSN